MKKYEILLFVAVFAVMFGGFLFLSSGVAPIFKIESERGVADRHQVNIDYHNKTDVIIPAEMSNIVIIRGYPKSVLISCEKKEKAYFEIVFNETTLNSSSIYCMSGDIPLDNAGLIELPYSLQEAPVEFIFRKTGDGLYALDSSRIIGDDRPDNAFCMVRWINSLNDGSALYQKMFK